MKKMLVLFTASLLLIMLHACSPKDNTLRVGMDLRYPPFETFDALNQPEGISVDIAEAFGAFLGVKVEIVNTNFSALILALNSGEIDIAIASMSITEERKQTVDFSDPYFYFKIISLVNRSFADTHGLTEDSTIEDILAIEGTKFIGLASQVSTTIPESYGKTVIEATNLGTAVESVVQGTADILMMSANPVLDGHNANPETTIVIWDAFVSSPIGMATKKGNQSLIDKANLFISTFHDDSGMYETLAEKWDAVLLERLGRHGLSFYIYE